MSTPVEVNHVVHRTQPFRVKSRDLSRDRIDFFGDPQLRWPPIDVSESVRPALPFGQRLNGSRPSLTSGATGLVHRNAKPIADVRIPDAIFVAVGGPLT